MAKRERVRNVPCDGERRERDHKTWWNSRKVFETWEQIQVKVPGDYQIGGAYMLDDRTGIWIHPGKEGRELLESMSLKLVIDENGELFIPRKMVIDVNRANLTKSDTPQMAELKAVMRLKQGDTPAKARLRMNELIARKKPNQSGKGK